MEALTGVSAGLLCAFDMVKSMRKIMMDSTQIQQLETLESLRSSSLNDPFDYGGVSYG